ncbi:MAG: rhomboid family intramembrane serine protease [Planctomycetes bacterium]|nr:rhomboid family intramembrane serine protease [Planctomycetota bacterium]MBI3845704.1 rhomboid family intramembrane serine protease [Planctomycetota bacterium]
MVFGLPSSRKGRPRMCRACGNLIGADCDECSYCGRKDRVTSGLLADPMRIFGSLGAMKVFTIVNVAYFALMVVIARLGSEKMGEPMGDFLGVPGLFDFQTFIRCGAHSPTRVAHGEVWRLVTACFIHFGVVHLLMNSMALLQLGATSEDLFGRRKTLVIYVAAGVGGNLVSQYFQIGGAGASGAIFGLLGCFLAYAVRLRSHLSDALKGYVVRMLVYGAAMGLVANVNTYAHAGGFVTGFLVAYALGPGEPVRNVEEKFVVGASWACIAIVVASFVAAGFSIAGA